MRWMIVTCACAAATVAAAQPAAAPLPRNDVQILVDEHHADQRAIALAQLAAARASPPIAALGRHILRDTRFADDQVSALARLRGARLQAPPSVLDQMAADHLQHLAALHGRAFDRAVLAAIEHELGDDLDRITATLGGPHDGDVGTLLATMRPMLVRYQAEAGWLARSLAPAT